MAVSEIDKKKEIQRLLNTLDPERLSKEDFVNSFQKVVELVLQIQKRQQEAIDSLERTYAQLLTKMQGDSEMRHNQLRGQVDNLFVGEQLKRMDGETKANFEKRQKELSDLVDKKINEFNRKMSEIDNEKVSSKKSLEGMLGVTKLAIDQKLKEMDTHKSLKDAVVEELKKEFEKVKEILANIPRGKAMGRARVPMPRMVDLTADQNGQARVFNIPPDTVRIFGAFSSQAPWAIAPGDITRSGNQITLDNTIAPRERTQTLILLTDALFYP